MPKRSLIPSRALLPQALSIVPYLTREEVTSLAAACQGRNRSRDELLIHTLFQTGIRISEALSLTPRRIGTQEGGDVLYIKEKGDKSRLVACPDRLPHRLKSFAFDRKLGLDDRIFKINRERAWQVIKETSERAGLTKRVYPHLFRHSGAIERLRQTGNPRALQIHLGHASPFMTMRYLSTLTAEEALRIQQEVVFD
ncbi:MAG: site-specific integrase [Deltaproteobacteria bacterium]|nr:site-specific integrase [Deltaproteobacteria bacterium]